MTLPTTADFNNAKRDLDDLAEIVTSPTVKDVPKRLGGNTPTLAKVMSETTDFLATQTQRLADRDAEIDQTLVRLRDHAPVRNRGAWISGTTYEVNDIWQAASDVWYVVVEEYVAGATDVADIASGKVFVHQVNIVADIPADTIADLRLFEPGQDKQHKNVVGHTVAGLGGGLFWHDASDTTSADDNGYVIVTTNGKRWKRKLETVVVDSAHWGVASSIPSESGLLAASEFAGTRDVYIKDGVYDFGSYNFSDYSFISDGAVTSNNITVSVGGMEDKFHLKIPTNYGSVALSEGANPIIDMNYEDLSFRDRGKTVDADHLVKIGDVDYLGRPIASRSTTNLASDPTLAGAVVGNLASGGSLPAGWNRSIPQVNTEVLEVGANTMTVKCQRVGTSEATTSLRSYVTMPSTLTHSKCVSHMDVEILHSTGSAIGVSISMISADVFRPSILVSDKAHVRTFAEVSPDDDIQLRILFLAEDGDYSLTAKISNVMMEQSDSVADTNPFTPSTSATKSFSVYNKLQGTMVGFTDNDVITTQERDLVVSNEGTVLNRVICTKQSNIDYLIMGASVLDWASVGASAATYNNTLLGIQSVSAPHSIQVLPYNQGVIRFEVREGERAGFDTVSVDRCEVLASQNELIKGVDHWYGISFYVEDGMPINTDFASIFQIHGGVASPVFSIDISNDVLKVIYGSSNSISQGSGNRVPFTINICPLERQSIYHAIVKVKVVDPSTGMGFLGVWVNGVEVINEPTYIGYDGFNPYAKLGLYRATSRHNQSVVYSNFSFSGESMQDKISNPDPFFSRTVC